VKGFHVKLKCFLYLLYTQQHIDLIKLLTTVPTLLTIPITNVSLTFSPKKDSHAHHFADKHAHLSPHHKHTVRTLVGHHFGVLDLVEDHHDDVTHYTEL